jgi:ssDNA-binding replication factor A large subunit
MEENYARILNKVSQVSGISKEELERKVEAKRAKLAGLISREGATQVIAAELGISFENEKFKIDELLPGMKRVNTIGKIINLSPVREFTTKKGDKGKVANLFIADDSSNVKVVLWDTNHISLIENGKLCEGKVVEIVNASMRDNELHLGSFSELKECSYIFENVVSDKVVKDKNIIDFRVGDSLKVRAFVVQVFEPKFFNVCMECKKKVNDEGNSFVCTTHGKVSAERRALVNIVLDDGSESIRSVLFHEQLPLIGLTELDNSDALFNQKSDLIGKEMIFIGDVQMNKFFNSPEFVVRQVKEIDVDSLISELEK